MTEFWPDRSSPEAHAQSLADRAAAYRRSAESAPNEDQRSFRLSMANSYDQFAADIRRGIDDDKHGRTRPVKTPMEKAQEVLDIFMPADATPAAKATFCDSRVVSFSTAQEIDEESRASSLVIAEAFAQLAARFRAEAAHTPGDPPPA